MRDAVLRGHAAVRAVVRHVSAAGARGPRSIVRALHHAGPGRARGAVRGVADRAAAWSGAFTPIWPRTPSGSSGSPRLGALMREYLRWPYGRCERVFVPVREHAASCSIDSRIAPSTDRPVDAWRRHHAVRAGEALGGAAGAVARVRRAGRRSSTSAGCRGRSGSTCCRRIALGAAPARRRAPASCWSATVRSGATCRRRCPTRCSPARCHPTEVAIALASGDAVPVSKRHGLGRQRGARGAGVRAADSRLRRRRTARVRPTRVSPARSARRATPRRSATSAAQLLRDARRRRTMWSAAARGHAEGADGGNRRSRRSIAPTASWRARAFAARPSDAAVDAAPAAGCRLGRRAVGRRGARGHRHASRASGSGPALELEVRAPQRADPRGDLLRRERERRGGAPPPARSRPSSCSAPALPASTAQSPRRSCRSALSGQAMLTTMVLLPAAVARTRVRAALSRAARPSCTRSIAVSAAFTALSTAFNLFAMRRGALVVGPGRGVGRGRPAPHAAPDRRIRGCRRPRARRPVQATAGDCL